MEMIRLRLVEHPGQVEDMGLQEALAEMATNLVVVTETHLGLQMVDITPGLQEAAGARPAPPLRLEGQAHAQVTQGPMRAETLLRLEATQVTQGPMRTETLLRLEETQVAQVTQARMGLSGLLRAGWRRQPAAQLQLQQL